MAEDALNMSLDDVRSLALVLVVNESLMGGGRVPGTEGGLLVCADHQAELSKDSDRKGEEEQRSATGAWRSW
jgi:hypothetical protein